MARSRARFLGRRGEAGKDEGGRLKDEGAEESSWDMVGLDSGFEK